MEKSMNLTPYLTFAGNGEEALEFYAKHLGGEVVYISKYMDSPMDVPQGYEDKLMHGSMMFEGGAIMASDAMPGADFTSLTTPGNIQLSLGFSDRERMDQVFHALSAGGEVTLPLQDTFWGDHFGMFRDRFGIEWMLSSRSALE